MSSTPEAIIYKKAGDTDNPQNTQPQDKIQIIAYQSIEAFKELQSDWDALMQQSQNQTIFLTWEWLFAWKKHLGTEKELWLVTAWIDNKLVGVAPLMLGKIKKHGIVLKQLCSLGSPHIDVGGFIVQNNDPQIHQALCNYLISKRDRWDLLELEEVEMENGKVELLKSVFQQSGFSTIETSNRHLHLEISGDWKTYLQSLPKKNRHEFRRKAKHVEISACTKFIRHTGKDVTCEDIAVIFSINKHGHFPGFYQPPEEQVFQHELIQHMAQRGWLDVSLLYLDDEPAAFCYGFIYNKKLEIWRIGFDMKYQHLSVGIVLMNWMLEDSYNHDICEVDFLRGEESYKEQWKPQARAYTQIRVASTAKIKPLAVSILLPKLSRYINKQREQIFFYDRLKATDESNHGN